MRAFVRSDTSVSVSLNSSFVMIVRKPGVKNASSGPRRPVSCHTIFLDGDTRIARLLSRSAMSRYPGNGPRRTGGRPRTRCAGSLGAGLGFAAAMWCRVVVVIGASAARWCEAEQADVRPTMPAATTTAHVRTVDTIEIMAVTAKVKLDAQKVRADFPYLEEQFNGKPFAYLDSAASAQKPRQVLEA